MTAAGAIGSVLVCEVLAECALGALAILCSAARADLARSVSDDPHRTLAEGAIEVPLFWPKPKADSFCGTRHNSLIRSTFASVV
jgi:hypothetical protein